MATLRVLPSISSLLNHPPQNFASRGSAGLRLPNHVKISSVRRNVRQTRGLGNEERICESSSDEARISESFADEVRVSESFADEAQVSGFFGAEFLERFARENVRQILGLSDEERISKVFADEARISEFFSDEARVSGSFPGEVRVSELFGAGFLEKFVRKNVRQIQGSVNEARSSERFLDEARISKSFANEERSVKFFGAGFLEKLVNEARISSSFAGCLERFVRENARELAVVSLVLALVCLPEDRALANGGGPVMEEFWDNVRRYGFYFFTVVSGALYSLTKPVVDLLRDPSTQVLVLVVVLGIFYLLYLTVSTMLGLNEFQYEYAQ